MSDKEYFDYILDDGKVVKCWLVNRQEYSNCIFDSGLVINFPPEDIYLRLEKNNKETMLFFRKDEAQALAWLLNGSMWSLDIFELQKEQENEN